jgi:hypothetical protein
LQLFKLGLIHVGLHPRLPTQRHRPLVGFQVSARTPDLEPSYRARQYYRKKVR